jgi:nucleotide-binding universal stress UspA family protein
VHILLPTDGSDIAVEATRRGVALLGSPTKVTLLAVVGALAADTGGGIEGPIYTPAQEAELRDTEDAHARQSLAATEAIVKALVPAAVIDQRIETGDPAAMICVVAEDLAVDVVVVGSHGKGFLSRALLGSVSEHVTRHAPCPVLVVRSQPLP